MHVCILTGNICWTVAPFANVLQEEDFVGALSIINNGKKLLWHAEKSLEEYGVYGLDEPVALPFRYFVEVDVSRWKKKRSDGLGLLVLSDRETVFTSLDDEQFSLCDKYRHERKAPHNLTEICRNRWVACRMHFASKSNPRLKIAQGQKI